MKKPACFRNNGFTLIEIMLVMVVIAVMASLLVVNIGNNPQRQLEREAKRLQTVLQLAADEALMQGVELALARAENTQQNSEGYQFLVFNLKEQHWQASQNEPFNYHALPQTFSMDVRLRSEASNPTFLQQISKLQKLGGNNQLEPLLLILSSGEITPFDIEFSHDSSNTVFRLASDGVSGIELK